MLSFVLTASEDETLYSLIARHGAILRRMDARDLNENTFGRWSSVVSADNLYRLDHAALQLGFESGGVLLKSHTAYPYNMVFATSEHQHATEAWALREEGLRSGEVGVMSSLLRHRPVLVFCERCLKDSGSWDGIHPWRRAHQLPGVFVCHRHGEALRTTNITRSGRRGVNAFAPLSDDIVRVSDAAPRLPPSERSVLLRYARASARLLHSTEPLDVGALQARMHELLKSFRWERAGSLVAMSRLVETLSGHPNVAPLLRAMGADFSDVAWTTALYGLLYRTQSSKHPLLVLMLLETVGASLDDLLAPTGGISAGDGVAGVSRKPGPVDMCANPACPEMQGAALVAFTVGKSRRATCTVCGFAIRTAKHPGQRPIILRTCAAWDTAVAAALSDPTTSVRAVSRTFNADATTIVRAARRCGVWREEWKIQAKLNDRANARTENLRQRHRVAWLAQPPENAALPIKELPKLGFNAYRWLLRHDREWFYENAELHSVRKHRRREEQLILNNSSGYTRV